MAKMWKSPRSCAERRISSAFGLGEKIPVDGVLSQGQSSADDPWSPEVVPVRKVAGAQSPSAHQPNRFVPHRPSESATRHFCHKIVAIVASAQRSRAPIQAPRRKISGYFVPGVIQAPLLPSSLACSVPSPACYALREHLSNNNNPSFRLNSIHISPISSSNLCSYSNHGQPY